MNNGEPKANFTKLDVTQSVNIDDNQDMLYNPETSFQVDVQYLCMGSIMMFIQNCFHALMHHLVMLNLMRIGYNYKYVAL